MDIIKKFGYYELAVLYIAKIKKKYLEFVESIPPPYKREEKWVLIISTMYGCPIGCSICDAGSYFKGNISTEDMIRQIDFMVLNHYPEKIIPIRKFKIQFARMGDPALNPNVLEVIKQLKTRYMAPGLMSCISTIAPLKGTDFMEELIKIKHNLYLNGDFQLQFSIHTTDEKIRNKIIPYPKWSLKQISEYGERFLNGNGRKITLNFAAEKNYPIDAEKIAELFNPKKFLIKLTPLNPTEAVKINGFHSLINPNNTNNLNDLIQNLQDLGFATILSIGELEENLIGSNCGQIALKYEKGTYNIEEFMPFQQSIKKI